MKYAIITSFLAALVAAQSVDDLVKQIPSCASTCLSDGTKAVNCDLSDFTCSCSKVQQLTSSVVPCLATSGCSTADQAKVLQLAAQICSQVGEGSEETAAVTAATAMTSNTGTATRAAVTSTTSPAAAGRMQAAGWAGVVAAAAAFAL